MPSPTPAPWRCRAAALAPALAVVLGAPLASAQVVATAGPPAAELRLRGTVRSAATRELVRHARISTDRATAETNEDGVYFLTLAAGTRRLRVRAIGFTPLDTTIDLRATRTVDFTLVRAPAALSEVVVRAAAERSDVDPRSPDMGMARLDLAAIRDIPAVLGEVDPIRSLTLLPGVSASSDFSTAFNVRGGSADQNLILLDEATIYNPAHGLGFLSVFNADAVDDATLYKGAIPPRFGGRLSSVVDIRQREGNANERAGSATIGLLASRLALEGPLFRRGSWLVAARRTYADLFTRASKDPDIRDNVAYFYDVNAKATATLGAGGTLVAAGYLGRDRFSSGQEFSAGWGNMSGTLRWNQITGDRLYSKLTIAASDYDYRLTFPVGSDSASWTARIRSLELRLDETVHMGRGHTLELGAHGAMHGFRPGEVAPLGAATLTPRKVPSRSAMDGALYVGEERELGPRWGVRYGARLSGFARVGPATIYRYAADAPVVYDTTLGRYEPGTLVDSVRYGGGQRVSAYGALEPRASVRFSLSPDASVKASYARTVQYLHLASKTNSPTPLDVWEPSGPYLRPQRGDQLGLGVQRVLGDRRWELSAEVFYKRSRDIVDFVDGADVILNDRLETIMLQGRGRAYGLELFARRQAGATTGWVSYTLSRAEQRFASSERGGGIEDGRWYVSPYDKTHDLSVVLTRPLRGAWTGGATFSFATGLPATYPRSRYLVDGLLLAEYGPRNSARLPAYHRLDLGITRKGARSELQVGAFNVYNRFNAQSVTFRQSEGDPLVSEAVELSVFGIVPSVSYTIHF